MLLGMGPIMEVPCISLKILILHKQKSSFCKNCKIAHLLYPYIKHLLTLNSAE